jgi:predicted transcriptional regulator
MKDELLGLGPTEIEIMGCLWVHGPLIIRQIRARICTYRLTAYTTILTVSSRMEEKGLIARHATGDGYNSALLLTPTVTRVELLTHALQAVCRNLHFSGDDRAALMASLSADA